MRRTLLLAATVCCLTLQAQQYTGMTGLIHVSSAEMNAAGTAGIGAHFLNKEFTPDNFTFGGDKYHTMSYYLNLTPFSWIELGYTCTLQKMHKRDSKGNVVEGNPRYYYQDRYFSVKIRPLKEGKWWPAIAIGANDPYGTNSDDGVKGSAPAHAQTDGDGKSQYFSNYYVAATKHIDICRHKIGVHIAYRHFKREWNGKWNGVVGGLTYRPSFAKSLRVIAEYTGDDVSVGADCLLWRHLLLQASLQEGKYFSGGVCYRINLLGKQ